MSAPLAIDLFCGLGGWTEGLLAAGYDVTGYDIEAHEYDGERYPARLVLQDVLTLDGAAFADAALIVASPPCQEFSYMAMPWSRAKQIARALRGEDEFPEGYKGSRTKAELTALFDACFRIQREASEAAGRHIPMVVENVRGAKPWVGRAKWSFGSYYLWGDVPALMPFRVTHSRKNGEMGGGSWFPIDNTASRVGAGNHGRDGRKNPGFRFDGSGRSFQSESVARHVADSLKAPGGAHVRDGAQSTARLTNPAEGRKGAGAEWFDQNLCVTSSKSPARKAASARIAKIPLALSHWIANVYCPQASPPPKYAAPLTPPAAP